MHPSSSSKGIQATSTSSRARFECVWEGGGGEVLREAVVDLALLVLLVGRGHAELVRHLPCVVEARAGLVLRALLERIQVVPARREETAAAARLVCGEAGEGGGAVAGCEVG